MLSAPRSDKARHRQQPHGSAPAAEEYGPDRGDRQPGDALQNTAK
jgi:hypothetical protein